MSAGLRALDRLWDDTDTMGLVFLVDVLYHYCIL